MVIHDNECREYKQGWNACNSGANFLSNPYSCLAYDGELNKLWERGFNECQRTWDDGTKSEPVSFTIENVNESFSITLPIECQDYLNCLGGCVFPAGSCKRCSNPKGIQ